jgi:hypothetical protein
MRRQLLSEKLTAQRPHHTTRGRIGPIQPIVGDQDLGGNLRHLFASGQSMPGPAWCATTPNRPGRGSPACQLVQHPGGLGVLDEVMLDVSVERGGAAGAELCDQ